MSKTEDAEASRLAAARDKVSDTAHAVLGSAGSAVGHVRDAATDALAAAKSGAGDALATAREKAGSAHKAAGDGIDGSPLAALIGGIALGAVAGALLPRSQKEAELLGPLGSRLGDAAREAFAAAKQAGLGSLDEAGFNREALRSQVDKLFEGASKAATAAGGAAVQSVRG